MTEIPASRINHDPYRSPIGQETFADGSVNATINKIGTVVDLNRIRNKHFDINSPASVMDITTEHFDEANQEIVRTDYIITESGYGPGLIISSTPGKQGIRSQAVKYNLDWINSLKSKPLTIGKEHDRLQGAKLMAISAAQPSRDVVASPDKKTDNPIGVALYIMMEGQCCLTNYDLRAVLI